MQIMVQDKWGNKGVTILRKSLLQGANQAVSMAANEASSRIK